MIKKLILSGFLLFMSGWSKAAWSQGSFATEDHFRELFMTAGYSTAFGAALGAAAIGLTENPGDKLRYVAVGGSLGFILGSMIGTYVIFTPVVSYQNQYQSMDLHQIPEGTRFAIEPLWSQGKLSSKPQGVRFRWLVAGF